MKGGVRVKLEIFFTRLDEGYYGVPVRPTLVNLQSLSYELEREVPKIIRKDRTVIWNEKKRKELIEEKLENVRIENSRLMKEWSETERNKKTMYFNDLVSVLTQEFNMNEEQLHYFMKEIVKYDYIRNKINREIISDIGNYANKINKLFELSNKGSEIK